MGSLRLSARAVDAPTRTSLCGSQPIFARGYRSRTLGTRQTGRFSSWKLIHALAAIAIRPASAELCLARPTR
jgi:hypothetical protein